MGFKPTTLRDLVGCSTTELLETLLVSKGQIVVDWNGIARLHSHVLAQYQLTNSIALSH